MTQRRPTRLQTDDLGGGGSGATGAATTYWSITACCRAARSSAARSAGGNCSEAWHTARVSEQGGGSLVRMHARAWAGACARARACVCVSERSLTSNSTRDDSAESRKEAGSGGSSAESRLSVTEASSAACGARLTGHAASGLAPPSLPPPSPHRRHHH